MLLKTVTASLFALTITSTQLSAQAFGISKGDDVSSYEGVSELQLGLSQINVPKPHPEFEVYVVKHSPETGVCMVRGIGKDHGNDRFGISVRRAFEELRTALDRRYAPSGLNDFLRAGALWDESDEWVMSIRQNDRAYQAYWDAETRSKLPEDVAEILLSVAATSGNSAYVVLQYRFDNDDACERAIKSDVEGGL